jgi:hypothetical protein
VPVPGVVRHGVSDSQMKSGAEKITAIINKILGECTLQLLVVS